MAAAAMRSLPAREERHCSPSFHPIPRACYRRVRDHDTIAVPHGRRSPRDGENPCHPASPVLLRALRPEAAAHEKKLPFQGAFCVLWQKTYGADRRISSAGKGGERAGQRKEKPCSSALSPCRCLGTSLALRLTHLRLGALSFPARQRQGPSSATGRNIFGGRRGGGGSPPFFKRVSCLPRHNPPGHDTRPGTTSRPVPDRWRSARLFR